MLKTLVIYSVCKCDTRLSVKCLMGWEVESFGQGWHAILLEFKAKPWPRKQSVKFKCQIWFKATKKFAKKCLDMSSL